MSIKAMTWAFGLPLEPRAKIALLAIADNARDDGVAWPSRDTIAEKSSQSRATVGRRIKALAELGIIAVFQRFREDGTQTTDELRLDLTLTPEDVMRKMQRSEPENAADTDDDSDDDHTEGGGYQPDTLGSQSGNPRVAVVTRGGLHCCNPQDEPSLEQDSPPNPPPGGRDPKSDQDKKPEPEHFAPFFEACQHWRTMDRDRALTVFRMLTLDEQGRAHAAAPLHAEECTKAKRRSKDAHKLLGERFWERYPHARLPERPPDPVWIDDGPNVDALRVLALIADRPPPRLIHDETKGRGVLRLAPVGPDLAALATVTGSDPLDWCVVEPDSREFNAWRHRIHDWTGQWVEPRIVMRRGTREVAGLGTVQNRVRGLAVPWLWPPRKDGMIYSDADSDGEAI